MPANLLWFKHTKHKSLGFYTTQQKPDRAIWQPDRPPNTDSSRHTEPEINRLLLAPEFCQLSNTNSEHTLLSLWAATEIGVWDLRAPRDGCQGAREHPTINLTKGSPGPAPNFHPIQKSAHKMQKSCQTDSLPAWNMQEPGREITALPQRSSSLPHRAESMENEKWKTREGINTGAGTLNPSYPWSAAEAARFQLSARETRYRNQPKPPGCVPWSDSSGEGGRSKGSEAGDWAWFHIRIAGSISFVDDEWRRPNQAEWVIHPERLHVIQIRGHKKDGDAIPLFIISVTIVVAVIIIWWVLMANNRHLLQPLNPSLC